MPHLVTTLGPKTLEDLGPCPILPHEHLFVDLRTEDQPGYAQANPAAVLRLMVSELERARAGGVTAIVEPSTVGVGRRADLLLAAPEAALTDWMLRELTDGIDTRHPLLAPSAPGTPSAPSAAAVPPLATGPASATDQGLTEAEAKLLRAAARASRATGAAVGSHTLRGPVARAQLDIFERAGADPARFVWIHAHREPDPAIHHELARRGASPSYDTIGDPDTDDAFLTLIRRALDAGLADRLLLSHGRGWYDPAHPTGGTPRPYTYLFDTFLPKLLASGVDPATVDRLTRRNPFAAFAR